MKVGDRKARGENVDEEIGGEVDGRRAKEEERRREHGKKA